MVERSRQDSSRDLLEELEEGWGTPPPPAAGMPLPGVTPKRMEVEPPADAGAAAAKTDDVPERRTSSPDLSSLDEGWLDDLFPGDDEDDEDDEDDQDEEPEPELPDERLDPEAFALAKKAREERATRRKEKKRAKAEAKRARQKARAQAIRQKQKAKKSRAASPARQAPPPPRKKEKRREPTPAAAEETTTEAADDRAVEELAKPRARSASNAPARRAPSTVESVKLLAIVLAVLLAIAAAVAAIVK